MQLTDLKGLGKVRQEALRAAGIFSLRELLYYLPKRYKDTTQITLLSQMEPGEMAAIRGFFVQKPRLNRFRGMSSVTAVFQDDSARISCVWFNQPWMQKQLPTDKEVMLYGRLEIRNGRKQITNPSIETACAILPIYRPLPAIPSKVMGTLIAGALEHVEEICFEMLPEGLRSRHGLMGIWQAMRQAHFPESAEMLKAANHRIAFERALLFQMGLSLCRAKPEAGVIIPRGSAEMVFSAFGFEPTNAQRRVLFEVLDDMADIAPMSRLIQGDVGCGKTAVAFGAVLACALSGYQAAMMAPTEILAAQHYETAQKTLAKLGVQSGLLLGGMNAAARREALKKIHSGEWQAIFGTHALISKDVEYSRLGLVVADEQHRFGVAQRTALIRKTQGLAPNVLVMSATPIPRTLALILYGDLDISIIDELPKGRKPVTTRIVPESKRTSLYAFLQQEVSKGRQAYIVCPLVDESEDMDGVKAAQGHYRELKRGALRGLRVGLTYGGQPRQEKEETIDAFTRRQLDVLVSTTVIEVGINVPNATVMVIEDAYRFGLSQLHQLRGRVGRGGDESWCFLLSEPNERLKTLASTNDGFVIAQRDLEMRGPGELVGTRQHGHVESTALMGDAKLIEEVLHCIEELKNNLLYKAERAIVEAHAKKDMNARLANISLN